MGNRSISNITFFTNAISPTDGEIFNVPDATTVNVDFIGSGTFTAVFEGKVSHLSEWDEVMCVNLKTLDMSTRATTFDTYQIDITGWSYIRVRLTNVSGNISALGKAVG